jgi:hypothetical protein
VLPKELLEVKRFKGKIFPKFAAEGDYELAEKIIKIFSAGRGEKYGKVMTAIKTLENARNFRKVRGFARVLENYCVEKACMFDIASSLDPVKVRMFLFERGFVTTRKERDEVIQYAARYFNTTPEEIEQAMYADREEELILIEVRRMSPEMLIKLYNLSLLQTTIFNCLRLTFWTSSNHKEIFRAIKRLGLMYELYDDDGQMVTEVTGAASILKLTRKYGTSIAKLIPSILKSENWWIRAEIVDESRIYHLEIDDRHRDLFPEKEERIDYDSSLEEEFARKLKALDYEIIREPGVIKTGRYAFIPDFLVRRDDKEVYVEIVGFWTSEYLKKKIEKVKNAEIPLVVIAREDYGEGRGSEDVILFSRKIPYNKVIKAINSYLKLERKIKFDKDVIDLKGFSLSSEELKRTLPENYVVAGGYAVKKDLFERIKAEICSSKPERLSDVKPILEKYGLGYSILTALGYRIKWIGLSEDNAVISK